MEKNKSQKIQLGIFLITGSIILITILMLVGGSRLFTKRKTYFIAYDNVSVGGLEIGAAVKYLGVRIGRVEDIRIDTNKVSRIIVQISVGNEMSIKTDVTAVASMVGITGLKAIELTGGSDSAPLLPAGSFIVSGKSLTDNISGKAEIIAMKTELLINNLLDITGGENKEQLKELIKQTNGLLANVNIILSKNNTHINNAMQNFALTSKEIKEISEKANVSASKINTILANVEQMGKEFDAKRIGQLVNRLDNITKDLHKSINHFDSTLLQSRNDYLTSMRLLRESLQNLKEVSRLLNEDPSVLLRGVKEQRN